MTISDRDRKILLVLVPLALIAAYWFLLLAPKREEATKIQDELTQTESARDTAVQAAAQLSRAKSSFASDYAAVIYLGKAAPTSLDMQSLMVQLDRSARGTGIQFTSIKAGQRTGGAASGGTAAGGGGPASSSTPAESGAGQAAQSAGGAVNESNNASAAAGASDPNAAGGAAGASGASDLDSVPLDFQFDGSFFDLADFFHRMKRFVRVANGKIIVRGRLLTIDSWTFDTKQTKFPHVKATVHATVYLAPKAQGVNAGASPNGPAGAPTAPTGQTASSNPAPPVATVTAP
jgi:hypothetical protein